MNDIKESIKQDNEFLEYEKKDEPIMKIIDE
jgi:TusA-related sulfurtransferase